MLGLEEVKEAKSKGRWTLRLLDSAVLSLAEKVDHKIHDDWDHAYLLRVEGFHEARLDVRHVEVRVKYIKGIIGNS